MMSVASTRAYRTVRRNGLAAAAAAIVTLFASTANAGITFPSVPLQVSPNVPANILFILDDSGSMTWDFLPDRDDMLSVSFPGGRDSSVNPSTVRDSSSWLNRIYYNPAVTYQPWRLADGAYMPNANWTSVSTHNTHLTGSANLGTRTFYVLPASATSPTDGTQFVQYQINLSGATRCVWNFATDRYSSCASVTTDFDWTAFGGIKRNLSQELQNYANWYQYHRTRMKAAKAGASMAFNGIDTNVRVGFRTIHNSLSMDIPVGTDGGVFTSSNRTAWFSTLFNTTGNGGTPLRPALQRAGAYFENTSDSGPWGPKIKGEQLACRQSFAILTTDGYHNSNAGLTINGNVDNESGATITPYDTSLPNYTYTPQLPYRDNESGSLADVAMHYWKRDLRPDLANRVPSNARNPAFWQHMVTFGVSLGATANLDPKTDLPNIISGSKQWPSPIMFDSKDTIDDFWHATLNGRGDFVLATNPVEFEQGLKDALAQITNQIRSNSNVAVTSNRLEAGTLAFEATFDSADWTGDLKAYKVTGSGVNASSYAWSAGERLAARSFSSRKIFRWNAATGAGAVFDWANLSAAEKAAFGNDETRFDYVRGDGSREQDKTLGVFRTRNRTGTHWLIGDISGSSPVYDAENKVVYVGANDGMLHAFNATNGEELFAYVPGGIDYADLSSLADPEYSHKFFVDGQLALAKIDVAGVERTMLYGFLGRGGKAGKSPAFALDVTNPTSFSASNVKWEVSSAAFTDAAVNVLEAPIVAKLNNGRTGVLFGNGYNSSTNRAALVVLDAEKGDSGPNSQKAVIYRPGGTAVNSNGLGAISTWDEGNDGIVDFVYAGDLYGRVWRFDLSRGNTGNWTSETGGINHVQLFQALDAGGNRQPVTGRVSVGINPTTYEKWIYFGTGRFLDADDRLDLSVQTWYGMKENTTTMPVRADLKQRSFLLQATVDGTRFRTIAPSSPTDMTGRTGWYLDLLEPPSSTARGERITGSTVFLGNVLLVASNSPNNDPCEPGMLGWINAIDPFTGGGMTKPYIDVDGDGDVDNEDKVDGNPAGSISLNNGYTTDPTFVGNQLIAGGEVGSVATLPSKYLGRISWRELIRNDE